VPNEADAANRKIDIVVCWRRSFGRNLRRRLVAIEELVARLGSRTAKLTA
jgi:hypothetical protein